MGLALLLFSAEVEGVAEAVEAGEEGVVVGVGVVALGFELGVEGEFGVFGEVVGGEFEACGSEALGGDRDQ